MRDGKRASSASRMAGSDKTCGSFRKDDGLSLRAAWPGLPKHAGRFVETRASALRSNVPPIATTACPIGYFRRPVQVR